MTLKSTIVAALLWVAALIAVSAGAADTLQAGFRDPPAAAKPRVWWHWMDGNVTQEGVRLDLQWMQRAGIGGVQNFDAALGLGGANTQSHVKKPLVYLTPEWQQTLRYSVEMANQAGLEFAIAASPGFSETGGPWVQPAQAMKKLVWSETLVRGGAPFKGKLAAPPTTTGSFQNIPYTPGSFASTSGQTATYYADVAALAYRAPASEALLASSELKVTSSAGTLDAKRLGDGDLAQSVSLPFGNDRTAWVQFTFPKPQRVQAFSIVIKRPTSFDPTLESGPSGWLEVSNDGHTFRRIADIPTGATFWSSALQQTRAFSPTAARVFRVVLERPPASLLEQTGLAPPTTGKEHQIAELVLHTGARVNRFEDKAGYSTRPIEDGDDTAPVAAQDSIRKGDIIDLTGRMRADGSLDWTPPPGRWVVMRFGYSLTGHTNHPASSAGTGLEVDKLNREHVKQYIDAYLSVYQKTLGADLIGKRGLQYVVNDSYEAGAQNWTDDMLAQFKQRRGYDALPWLPVLAGRVLESAAASDRFLWDFRKTLGELIVESHYEQLSASLRERGLGRYGESHEHLRAFIGDGMAVKKSADVPMSAIWAAPLSAPGFSKENYEADIRESASVAHIYGKKLVAAESFTSFGVPYVLAPEDLKPIADRAMAAGLSRFVIHTSVHQPDDRPGPGLGLGPFGQWFTRKETWAEQAHAWTSYLARSCYLLQQGRFVADIAYLYGEDTNVTSLFYASAPPVPPGHNFDFINADAVLNELSVKDGKLFTRAGMQYRLLVLDPSTQRMSLSLLRKLRELVRAGAVLTGPKPAQTPSNADDENEFHAAVADLWGSGSAGVRSVGAGKVFLGHSIDQALSALQIPADLSFNIQGPTPLRFVHRALEDGELYFIASDLAQPLSVLASFRVSGRQPELWRADTATITPLSYEMRDGHSFVPLHLEPNDAVFVVFRKPTEVSNLSIPTPPPSTVLTIVKGSWQVSFPANLGAPAQARFDTLHSWTEHADPGIKYFSGTATYTHTLKIRPEWLRSSARVWLDLGQVKNVAEVLVNGRSMGVLWKAPFTLDIADALTTGDNRLEIKVSNLWPNRLIGDKQPGARKIAFATFDPFKADSPLLPSGLLGPVTLLGEGLQ